MDLVIRMVIPPAQVDSGSKWCYDNMLRLSNTLFQSYAQTGEVERLLGGSDSDQLYSSMGDDTLDGGTGSDRFW